MPKYTAIMKDKKVKADLLRFTGIYCGIPDIGKAAARS
jgi:hypothetical protein